MVVDPTPPNGRLTVTRQRGDMHGRRPPIGRMTDELKGPICMVVDSHNGRLTDEFKEPICMW